MAGHDRITAEGRRFFEQIEELKKLQVRVGYQRGDKTEEDGTDLVDIAVLNEVGTENIPARPFMRNSVDNNQEAIGKACKAALKSVVQGGTAEQALKTIGNLQAGYVQDTISKSKDWAEPNAESTIRQKTKNGNVGDAPLMDTGQLRQSATAPGFVIVPKGENE